MCPHIFEQVSLISFKNYNKEEERGKIKLNIIFYEFAACLECS
jgi:hypothetical protein